MGCISDQKKHYVRFLSDRRTTNTSREIDGSDHLSDRMFGNVPNPLI